MEPIIKQISEHFKIDEKTVAQIMKEGFFIGRNCVSSEKAIEVGEEFNNFIYKK